MRIFYTEYDTSSACVKLDIPQSYFVGSSTVCGNSLITMNGCPPGHQEIQHEKGEATDSWQFVLSNTWHAKIIHNTNPQL